jgi:hypothetical protein
MACFCRSLGYSVGANKTVCRILCMRGIVPKEQVAADECSGAFVAPKGSLVSFC